ncbi:MAG: hypothetical protein OXB88_01370 [Bacteriovoracales bacterium]|nr:hypothetical protein [Bacteriovoracales bacterium]
MALKTTTPEDVRNFVKEAEEGRKINISQETIDRINERSRQIEKERKKNKKVESPKLPKVAKSKNERSRPLEI